MVNKIPPIVIKPEDAFDDSLAPVVGGQPPEENNFYFKIPPPEKPLTIKSSVVMRLPLYNSDAVDDSAVPGQEGKVSFENIYRNYTPEDFARLMTTQGVLSKAIRYGLLYNYFGFPVANIESGTQNYPEIEDTQFSFSNIKRRVASRDKNYGLTEAQYADGFGNIFVTQGIDSNEFDADGKVVFVEYAKGLYQLGRIGKVPSFVEAPEQIPSDDTFEPLSKIINQAIQTESPNYKPAYEFFNFLHGSYTNGNTQASIGGSFSHVDVIGVDAQDSGLKVEAFSLIEGFSQSDLRFTGQWNADSNPISKTYARAWRPSTAIKGFNYNSGETPADLDFYVFGAGGTPETGTQYTWKQQITDNFDTDDTLIDSFSITLGGTNENSWFVNVGDYLGASLDPVAGTSGDFSLRNLASMYKLVPSNLDVTPSSLGQYRKDPSKTLNKIYSRIFKYVRDVAPAYMIQQQSPSGQGKINSPLNASDIITPEAIAAPDGVQNKSFLRKFRLGWELQSHNSGTGKPVPSWQYDNLGPTHVIGTFDANAGGIAYKDIILNTSQDINLKYSEKKVKIIFKKEHN